MSNPYELRFQILQMAREMLEREQDTFAYTFWQIESKLTDMLNDPDGLTSDEIAKMSDLVLDLMDKRPDPITTEQVKDKANELYEFVQKS